MPRSGNRNKDRAKFVELAEKRVTRAIKDLRLISNLSNRSNYSYSEEDVQKILRVLEGELREVRRTFETKGRRKTIDFKLHNDGD